LTTMMISNRWKGNAEVGRLDILLHPDRSANTKNAGSIRIRIKSMRIHNPAFNKYDKKERFIILFFHSDKLKRKAERVEAKQKTSEEKNDRSCCCTICPQIISKPIRLLNKKDVYQHRIPKNLLLTHLFLLETRSRTRTRFVASNSWLKDWPRKR